MKILVTGATGYLGRSILAACRAAGHETLAFSRHASQAGLPGAGGRRRRSRCRRGAIRGAAMRCDLPLGSPRERVETAGGRLRRGERRRPSQRPRCGARCRHLTPGIHLVVPRAATRRRERARRMERLPADEGACGSRGGTCRRGRGAARSPLPGSAVRTRHDVGRQSRRPADRGSPRRPAAWCHRRQSRLVVRVGRARCGRARRGARTRTGGRALLSRRREPASDGGLRGGPRAHRPPAAAAHSHVGGVWRQAWWKSGAQA